jgi:hypothetical protein
VTMRNAVFWDVAPCALFLIPEGFPPKRRFILNPHGATSQKTAVFKAIHWIVTSSLTLQSEYQNTRVSTVD